MNPSTPPQVSPPERAQAACRVDVTERGSDRVLATQRVPSPEPAEVPHAPPSPAYGLRDARRRAGLSAALVARRAGLSARYVLQLEREYLRAAQGDRTVVLPPLATAERLGAACRSEAFPDGAPADVFYRFAPRTVTGRGRGATSSAASLPSLQSGITHGNRGYLARDRRDRGEGRGNPATGA